MFSFDTRHRIYRQPRTANGVMVPRCSTLPAQARATEPFGLRAPSVDNGTPEHHEQTGNVPIPEDFVAQVEDVVLVGVRAAGHCAIMAPTLTRVAGTRRITPACRPEPSPPSNTLIRWIRGRSR